MLSSPFLCYFSSLQGFGFFCVFLYMIIYVLNIASAVKKMPVNESDTFSLKTFIKELDFLGKTVIIQ